MRKILFALRCEDELGTWSCEYSHTVVFVVYEFVAYEQGHLETKCREVVFGIGWCKSLFRCACFVEIEMVAGDAQRRLGLYIETAACEAYEGVYGVAHFVALYGVVVETVALDFKIGVVVGYSLKTGFYTIVNFNATAVLSNRNACKKEQHCCN